MLTGAMVPSVQMESVWLVGPVLTALLSFINPNDSSSFHSGYYNSGTNPDRAFASAGLDSRLLDRRVWSSYPGHNMTIVTHTTMVCSARALHAC